MVYGLMFAGLGLAKAFLWRHAVKCGLTDTSEPEVRSISRRVWSVPVSATVVTGLAWAGVPFAIAGFMLTPLVALAFDRIRRR